MTEPSDDVAAPHKRWRVTIFDLVWPVLGVVVGTALLVAGLGVLVALLYRGHSDEARGIMLSLRSNYWIAQGLTALIYLGALLVLWLTIRRLAPSAFVGRFAPVRGTLPALAAVTGVAFAIILSIGIGALQSSHLVTFHATPSEEAVVPHVWSQFPLAILTLAVLAPVAEEIYFRGLLLSWLDARLGKSAAVLLSAAAFGFFHFRFETHAGVEGWFLTALLALLGIVNGVWVYRTRSLWPAIVTHGAYNGFLVLGPLLTSGL